VQRGAPVGIQLVLYSAASAPRNAEVAIHLAGIPIKRQLMVVRPGWQVLTTSVPALQQGTMALEVELTIPEEGLQERRAAYTEIEGPPHVLVVADQPTSLPPLARALKQHQIDTSLVSSRELPMQPMPLMDYDAVLLLNVSKSSLQTEQLASLRTYVEDFGGGLVMVGLGGELSKEIATPTALDDLLPVTYEPKGLQERHRRVCMIMLIDRSASMMGPRIAATKRAAVAMVNQLADEDLVGVLAFDTRPYVVVEVQQAGQVGQKLIDKLVRLKATGGTDVYPALTAAKQRLDQTDATMKHILLLSDGNTPFQRESYRRLVEEFKRDGVSVSTIGIGSVFINTEYLTWLADSTSGTFYVLRSLEELPQLVAQDAEDVLGELPFTEGSFQPVRHESSEWFGEITDWPRLRGYLTTIAKPGAQSELVLRSAEEAAPLLARWVRGRGRVAAFTSDADVRWAPDWVSWPRFGGVWAQVARWAMRPRLSEEVFVMVDERSGSPKLVVEGALRDPQGVLVAADGPGSVPLSFVQTGAWRWQASLEQAASGWYGLALESKVPSASDVEQTQFTKRWVKIGNPPATSELTGQAPYEPLLRQVARMTSGSYDAPDLAFLPPTTTTTSRQPLLPWLLPLVLLLLLVDIALRGGSML
jgi:Mg-chelatase subunit ChlD